MFVTYYNKIKFTIMRYVKMPIQPESGTVLHFIRS